MSLQISSGISKLPETLIIPDELFGAIVCIKLIFLLLCFKRKLKSSSTSVVEENVATLFC